ncbi:UDP-glucose/GDP-mannose dehydrogenase family protein, partial [Planctomycetota bacterium]
DTAALVERYPFRFAFNPEFLREKHALEDMQNTSRVVIGANDDKSRDELIEVYKPLFPDAEYITMDTRTAEMTKYTANVFLAAQIALANEIYNICKSVGVDYDTVKKTVLLDERIARNIDVPGPDGDFGFGGKCFPKDLNALIYLARENMYRPYLLEEVWRLNERVRHNSDWLDIDGAVVGVNP